jgi:hypothetical protein
MHQTSLRAGHSNVIALAGATNMQVQDATLLADNAANH